MKKLFVLTTVLAVSFVLIPLKAISQTVQSRMDLPSLQMAAEDGDSEAQFELGKRYY